jgi:hypothetical protein
MAKLSIAARVFQCWIQPQPPVCYNDQFWSFVRVVKALDPQQRFGATAAPSIVRHGSGKAGKASGKASDRRLVRPTLRGALLGLEIGTSRNTLPVGAG